MTKRLGCALLVLSVAGCTGGSGKLTPAKLDPAEIGEAAIAQYDKDGDQMLSKAELKECPGLILANFDTDKDGNISATEIEERIALWLKNGVARLNSTCTVLYRRQPMMGATVRLVPEEFFGDAIPEANGKVDENGTATFDTGDGIPGIAPGIYKVQIEHADVDVSAKYNTETILGMAVDPMDAYSPQPMFHVQK